MADRDDDKEQDKGFRIVDRRHFTAEGEARNDAPAESEATPPPSPPASTKAAKGAEGAPTVKGAPSSTSGPSAGAASHRIDFLSFVASLATNALAAMGVLPDEQAQGLPRNPELAREYIDILGMLQEKTRGNLSRQEESAMAQILTDLRLQFVESTRRR